MGHTLGFTHNFASSINDRASVMDYPHPNLSFANNQLDIEKAYAVGIGEWDKVTVAYSYSDFPDDVNEVEELRSILSEAQAKGLRFISDTDARASGGSHISAHLWDNGANPYDELNRVMEIRRQAITNFSEDNITSYESYSTLEDVFVPLYFFHRYQTEAVAKVIGGLDYNYKLKGDGQEAVKPVSKDEQLEALNAIIATLDPKELAIPEDKLSLFPPRVYGYPKTRESFKGKTGLSFDPLSAATTASDFSLKFLLHPERANRLVLQQSLDPKQLGLEEVLSALIDKSFGKRYEDGYLRAIQLQTNVTLLNYIMNLAVNEKAYFQTKAIAQNTLVNLFESMESYGLADAYTLEYKRVLKTFFDHPEKFELKAVPKIPDGSPIGGGLCTLN